MAKKTKGQLWYTEQLKKPAWQKKRLEILNRDNFRCQECGETEEMLVVHHKAYINNKMPWEYPAEYYATLCKSCHDNIDKNTDDAIDRLVTDIRKMGLLPRTIDSVQELVYSLNNFTFQGSHGSYHLQMLQDIATYPSMWNPIIKEYMDGYLKCNPDETEQEYIERTYLSPLES